MSDIYLLIFCTIGVIFTPVQVYFSLKDGPTFSRDVLFYSFVELVFVAVLAGILYDGVI